MAYDGKFWCLLGLLIALLFFLIVLIITLCRQFSKQGRESWEPTKCSDMDTLEEWLELDDMSNNGTISRNGDSMILRPDTQTANCRCHMGAFKDIFGNNTSISFDMDISSMAGKKIMVTGYVVFPGQCTSAGTNAPYYCDIPDIGNSGACTELDCFEFKMNTGWSQTTIHEATKSTDGKYGQSATADRNAVSGYDSSQVCGVSGWDADHNCTQYVQLLDPDIAANNLGDPASDCDCYGPADATANFTVNNLINFKVNFSTDGNMTVIWTQNGKSVSVTPPLGSQPKTREILLNVSKCIDAVFVFSLWCSNVNWVPCCTTDGSKPCAGCENSYENMEWAISNWCVENGYFEGFRKADRYPSTEDCTSGQVGNNCVGGAPDVAGTIDNFQQCPNGATDTCSSGDYVCTNANDYYTICPPKGGLS